MKKIVITSLVLFIFTVSGCKDDDGGSALRDCQKKGEGWVWDVVKEECIVDPTNEEDCKDKGEGWLWIEENKKCEQQVAALGDKEKCEAKGAGWVWNEDKATDAGEEYKKCQRDLANDCTDPAKPMVKNASPLECVAAPYIIINFSGRSLSYKFGSYPHYSEAMSLDEGSCKSIDEQDFEIYTVVHDSTQYGDPIITICATGSINPCPSEGIYEVSAGRTGFVVTKADKTVEELRKMGCFRYLIEAEGPL